MILSAIQNGYIEYHACVDICVFWFSRAQWHLWVQNGEPCEIIVSMMVFCDLCDFQTWADLNMFARPICVFPARVSGMQTWWLLWPMRGPYFFCENNIRLTKCLFDQFDAEISFGARLGWACASITALPSDTKCWSDFSLRHVSSAILQTNTCTQDNILITTRYMTSDIYIWCIWIYDLTKITNFDFSVD